MGEGYRTRSSEVACKDSRGDQGVGRDPSPPPFDPHPPASLPLEVRARRRYFP